MKLPDGLQRVECPEPVEGLSWVYILLMRNGTLYVGQSHDIAKRLQRHAVGTGSRQVKQLKEFVLVFVEGAMDSAAATKRERQLKKWSRAKKIALISGDYDTLKFLSKSREP
ncbi:MAG: GIY-YIG nuclease family protein [Opitutales bacterium]